MTREAAIFEIVNGDPILQELGVQKTYRSNAPDSPEADCFISLIWGSSNHVMPEDTVHPRELTAWVYDSPGYYGRVDAILDRLRVILTDAVGGVVAQVGWVGDSGDLYDDKYVRVLRTGTYSVH